jgi:dihydroorotase-like cyclic amidohydrolase
MCGKWERIKEGNFAAVSFSHAKHNTKTKNEWTKKLKQVWEEKQGRTNSEQTVSLKAESAAKLYMSEEIRCSAAGEETRTMFVEQHC